MIFGGAEIIPGSRQGQLLDDAANPPALVRHDGRPRIDYGAGGARHRRRILT